MGEPEWRSAAEAEQLNEAGLADFTSRAGEAGAVTMLNLLAFKPEGGAERYAEYTAAVTPLLERVGGRIVFAGAPAAALIGEGWDLVALVEYPSRQAFIEMIGSPEYLEVAHLRTEALVRSELHPIDPVELPQA